jgi:hypothetical protein
MSVLLCGEFYTTHEEPGWTNFSRAIPRRLAAEVSWDIVTQATSNDEKHQTFLTNMEKRAVAVPGASVRNRARNNSPTAYPLAIFGRSVRDSNCDCDRSEDPSLLQTIFLRNDDQVLKLLDSRNSWLAQVAAENNIPFKARVSANAGKADLKQLAQLRRKLRARLAAQQKRLQTLRKQGDRKDQIARLEAQVARLRNRLRELSPVAVQATDETEDVTVTGTIDVASAVEEAWLRTLSRQPTEKEAVTAAEFIAQHANHIDGLRDVMWALLNTKEFIVNH